MSSEWTQEKIDALTFADFKKVSQCDDRRWPPVDNCLTCDDCGISVDDLCDGRCCPCEFVPPVIDTRYCQPPYIVLERSDDLTDEGYSGSTPWWNHRHVDWCLQGKKCLLRCCGCTYWEFDIRCESTDTVLEEYSAITYRYKSPHTVTIEGTGSEDSFRCSFGQSKLQQSVFLNFFFKRAAYNTFVQRWKDGDFEHYTRDELLYGVVPDPEDPDPPPQTPIITLKCAKSITIASNFDDLRFRFQHNLPVNLEPYFEMVGIEDIVWESAHDRCPSPPESPPAFTFEPHITDAGSIRDVLESAQLATSNSYVKEIASVAGWQIRVVDDLSGIESLLEQSEEYARIMKSVIEHGVGGDELDEADRADGVVAQSLIGYDCRYNANVPACEWMKAGVPLTILGLYNLNLNEGGSFSNATDGSILERGDEFCWGRLAMYENTHSGNPNLFEYPVRFGTGAKTLGFNYGTSGSGWSRNETHATGLLNGWTLFASTYPGGTNYAYRLLAGSSETFNWTCGAHTVDVVPHNACANSVTIPIVASSGSSTLSYAISGRAVFSASVAIGVDRRLYLTSANLIVQFGAETSIATGATVLSLSTSGGPHLITQGGTVPFTGTAQTTRGGGVTPISCQLLFGEIEEEE